jgi:hypothetical protein
LSGNKTTNRNHRKPSHHRWLNERGPSKSVVNPDSKFIKIDKKFEEYAWILKLDVTDEVVLNLTQDNVVFFKAGGAEKLGFIWCDPDTSRHNDFLISHETSHPN